MRIRDDFFCTLIFFCTFVEQKLPEKDMFSDHIKRYRFAVAFFATIFVNVSAQNADTLIFQSKSIRSVGCGFPALRYDLLSPLNHSGYSIGFSSSRYREKPNHLTQFKTHLELGVLHNQANDSYITMLGFNGAWSKHWIISDRERPLLALAGFGTDVGLCAYMKDDNTNNPVAYFFNLSVNPGVIIKYRFKINGSIFELGQQIEMPFCSLISSSGYSSSLPYGIAEEDASFFEAMRFASFGSLKKCVTITTLDINSAWQQHKRFPNLRISYVFAGMNYRNNDFKIKSVNNMITFGAIFYLYR